MSNSPTHIVDATETVPALDPYRILARERALSGFGITSWDECLCVRFGGVPSLVRCRFRPLAEVPGDVLDEDSIAGRIFNEHFFPPAFLKINGTTHLVSDLDGDYLNGPLIDCEVLSNGEPKEIVIGDCNEQTISAALVALEWHPHVELIAEVRFAIQREPVASSQLTREIIDAYLSTDYATSDGPEPIRLRVGDRCHALGSLLKQAGTETATFITAWNPKGDRRTTWENRFRNDLMRADLQLVASEIMEGAGTGQNVEWPPEESFLALGLRYDEAIHLGRHYDQNAIIWVTENDEPKLVLLA